MAAPSITGNRTEAVDARANHVSVAPRSGCQTVVRTLDGGELPAVVVQQRDVTQWNSDDYRLRSMGFAPSLMTSIAMPIFGRMER